MHDEMLERRLRDALRAEGDALNLTITPAELERRLATRRRARATRGFGLVLAAALTIGALGAAAVAGGFFKNHGPSPAPSQLAVVPSTSATSPPQPTLVAPPASGSPGPLVSLADLIEAIGPSSVVEAQAFGAGNGVEHVVDAGPAAIELGPIERAGDYRLWVVCDGASLVVERQDAAGDRAADDLPCGRQPSAMDLTLEAGGRVRVAAATLVAWRAVLQRTGGDVTEHATAITPPAPAADTILLQGEGPVVDFVPVPSDAPAPRTVLGGIPTRASGTLLASCAGSSSIRVTIDPDENMPPDVEPLVEVRVPCDGALHTDDLRFALTGGVLAVQADRTTHWQVALVGDSAPFQLDPGDPSWQTIEGTGPTMLLHPVGFSMSDAVSGKDHRIRIVVTCQGGPSVEVVVSGGKTVSQEVGRFTVQCAPDGVTTEGKIFELPSAGFSVEATPEAAMWLAVAVQEPRNGS